MTILCYYGFLDTYTCRKISENNSFFLSVGFVDGESRNVTITNFWQMVIECRNVTSSIIFPRGNDYVFKLRPSKLRAKTLLSLHNIHHPRSP